MGVLGLAIPALAKATLAMAAIGAAVVWSVRSRRNGAKTLERLNVAGRASLSPKHGVALVQADSRTFLVVFGEGFAEIRPVVAPENPQ